MLNWLRHLQDYCPDLLALASRIFNSGARFDCSWQMEQCQQIAGVRKDKVGGVETT